MYLLSFLPVGSSSATVDLADAAATEAELGNVGGARKGVSAEE